MLELVLMLLAQANLGGGRTSGVRAPSLPSVSISNFSCPSDIVVSGATLVCSVTLTAPAPYDGFRIPFTTDNLAVLVYPSPFPLGSLRNTVLFSVAPGTPSGSFTIQGQMRIRIAALPTTFVSSLNCDATSLAPGASSTCTATLNVVPPGNFDVSTAAEAPLVVPATSVTIAGGTNTAQVQVTRSSDNTILEVASILVGTISWSFVFPDHAPPIQSTSSILPIYEPAFPLLQDTTAATQQIMQLVAPCGTDAPACAAGFANICAMPSIPLNCLVNCGPGGYVSCNAPVIQDANGVWSTSSRNR